MDISVKGNATTLPTGYHYCHVSDLWYQRKVMFILIAKQFSVHE